MTSEKPRKTFNNVPSANITRSPRQRSPNYPSISLREAVERVSKLYHQDGRAGSPLDSAVKHFGFNRAHGTAMALVSALRKYGLVEVTNNRVTITARAIAIIVYPDGDRRKFQAIQEAALAPEIYAELYNRFFPAGKLSSEQTLKAELEAEMKFNPKAVVDFVKDFKETLIYAALLEEDGVTLHAVGGEEGVQIYVPKIGDYVQWEPQGVLQFPEPQRIRAFSEDGRFAFVDGCPTGLPTSELTLQATPVIEQAFYPEPDKLLGTINALSKKSTTREDVFSLTEGKVTIQWPTPLSEESIQDLRDWLKIVERKIARSIAVPEDAEKS